MRLYSDILTYRYYPYAKYVPKKDMSTPRFESEKKLVHMVCDRVNPKYSFRRMALEVAREGKRAYIFRCDFENKVGKERVDFAFFQELPSDWWKPTSKTGDSYFGVSFDFSYFWQAGTSLDQFPPKFKEYYQELTNVTNVDKYGKKSINLTMAKDLDATIENINGRWYFWKELDPTEVFVFSSDESHAWVTPSFAGLFLQSQDLSSYQLLQQQLTSIPLNSMILATIPMHDESKQTGQRTNDMRLSETVVTGFQYLFNNMAPSGTGLFASPFEDYKHVTFPNVPNGEKVYHEAMAQFVSTAGTNGLMSVTDKPTTTQVKASQYIESRMADNIYDQFINAMNIIFETKLNLKYTWKFKLFGSVFTDKEDLEKVEKGLTLGMHYLLPKHQAYHDLDSVDSDGLADQVDACGIYKKMKPLTSAYQSTDKKDTGRAKKEDSDDDSTVASQDDGTNLSENRA